MANKRPCGTSGWPVFTTPVGRFCYAMGSAPSLLSPAERTMEPLRLVSLLSLYLAVAGCGVDPPSSLDGDFDTNSPAGQPDPKF